jgi:hypothetical protein
MKKLFILFISCVLSHASAHLTNAPLLLLQTFGSPDNPGRQVSGNTERGVTIQLAEAIYDALADDENATRVFIINPDAKSKRRNNLESINKINQAQQAVVIQLSASKTTLAKPSCSIFYRCYNPLTDQIKRPVAPLTPIPFEDVYLINFNQSKALAKNLASNLQEAKNDLDINDPAGIPLTNIRGIRHQVVQIEISINKDSSFSQLGTIFADAIKKSLLPA